MYFIVTLNILGNRQTHQQQICRAHCGSSSESFHLCLSFETWIWVLALLWEVSTFLFGFASSQKPFSLSLICNFLKSLCEFPSFLHVDIQDGSWWLSPTASVGPSSGMCTVVGTWVATWRGFCSCSVCETMNTWNIPVRKN